MLDETFIASVAPSLVSNSNSSAGGWGSLEGIKEVSRSYSKELERYTVGHGRK